MGALCAEDAYRSKTFTNKLTPNPQVTLVSSDTCEHRALFDLGTLANIIHITCKQKLKVLKNIHETFDKLMSQKTRLVNTQTR